MSKKLKIDYSNESYIKKLSSDCELFVMINKISISLSKHYPQHNIYTIIKEYDAKFPCMSIISLINQIKKDYPLINNKHKLITSSNDDYLCDYELNNLQWLTGC